MLAGHTPLRPASDFCSSCDSTRICFDCSLPVTEALTLLQLGQHQRMPSSPPATYLTSNELLLISLAAVALSFAGNADCGNSTGPLSFARSSQCVFKTSFASHYPTLPAGNFSLQRARNSPPHRQLQRPQHRWHSTRQVFNCCSLRSLKQLIAWSL